MGLFFRKARADRKAAFDPAQYRPAMRVSICTGERTAGFQDRETGDFHDVMQVPGDRELSAFCREYGVKKEDIVKIY